MAEQPQECDCGHGFGLHDGFGCAAYLGAFPATANITGHCRCRQSRDQAIAIPCLNVPAGRTIASRRSDSDGVVAVVEVRERPGSAIGICESPPALEFGGTAGEVLSLLLRRLRSVIAPPADGSLQRVRVIRSGFPERIEALG